MSVKKAFLEAAVESIMKIDPNLPREDVERIVFRKLKEKIKDPSVIADNNVTGATENMSLTQLCDWMDREKPVVSGNATFYVQPTVLTSPTSWMLRELKRGRKAVKRKMFDAQKAGDDDLYRQLDLVQMNLKVIMNAEYGASGAPTAAFYTKYSPAATTLMAQSIITTMAAFFEGYVGDNQKFFHINECMDWMNTVRKKDKKIHKWISVPTVDEVAARIRKHFMTYDMNNGPIIQKYLSNCTEQELVYIFYANNMKEFLVRHLKASSLIKDVLYSLPHDEAVEKEIPDAYKDKFEAVRDYNAWVYRLRSSANRIPLYITNQL